MFDPSDYHYMSHALEIARSGRYTVSPNPMVGCVIVKNNQIIAEGFHEKAGEAHAEIRALLAAGDAAKNAVMYVTLEPCCHHGRTPPCTKSIIQSGIKKLFAATLDPNPLVEGKGLTILQDAGIEVSLGLAEDKAKELNEIFFYFIKTKLPFVFSKWAMSFDGKTVTNKNDSRQISSHNSCIHTHDTRHAVDAILIGANTLIHDDPSLTVRYADAIKKHPIRMIVTTRDQLPKNLKLFQNFFPGKTIIASTKLINESFKKIILGKNIEWLVFPKNKNGFIDVRELLIELGNRNISSLLVEGGQTIHEQFFEAKLVNKVQVYLSPWIISALEKKQNLKNISFKKMNVDYFFEASYEG